MAEELEQVHCVIPKIYVFQIPPTTGVSTGYSARDWPKKAMWSGRLRVVSKGDKATVLLEHIDRDGVFAVCPYTTTKAVEQVNDSSRYFVIRVEGQGGRSAAVGIGFKERNEAFDFRIALQDATKQNSDKAAKYVSSLPSQDFSLAEGETIHVNMGGKSEHHKGGDASVGGPIMKLSAPGTGGGKKKKKKKKKNVIGPEPVGTRVPVTRQAARAAVTGGVRKPSAAAPPQEAKAVGGIDALTDDLFSMSMEPAKPAAAPAPAPAAATAAAPAAAASDNPFDVFDF